MPDDTAPAATYGEVLHGHRLPEANHEPVVWRYRDGCTVEVNEDGSHTFTPFYDRLAPAPTAPAGLLAVVDKAIYDWPAEGPQTLAEFIADRLAAIASPSEEPGLDVERLTIAVGRALSDGVLRPTWYYNSKASAAADAEAIAAEYARLAKEPGS